MCWKFFIFPLITIFTFSLVGLADSNGPQKKYLYVNSSSLNVRKAPNTNSKIVGKLKKSQKILVIQNSQKRKWAQVISPVKGYVSRKYLISKKTKSMYVNSSFLNVRSQPNLKSKIVGKLDYMQNVQVIPSKDGWSKINSPIKGFVYSSYLIDKREEDLIKSKDIGYVEKTKKGLIKAIKNPTEVKIGFLMDSTNRFSLIGLEFKVDLKTTLVAQIGNYSYEYQDGDYEEKASYFLLGFSGRIYSQNKRQGLYLGFGFDVISGQLEIKEPKSDGYEIKEMEILGIIPMVSTGFKYKYGSFAIEPGLILGYITGDIKNNLITAYGLHIGFVF